MLLKASACNPCSAHELIYYAGLRAAGTMKCRTVGYRLTAGCGLRVQR